MLPHPEIFAIFCMVCKHLYAERCINSVFKFISLYFCHIFIVYSCILQFAVCFVNSAFVAFTQKRNTLFEIAFKQCVGVDVILHYHIKNYYRSSPSQILGDTSHIPRFVVYRVPFRTVRKSARSFFHNPKMLRSRTD